MIKQTQWISVLMISALLAGIPVQEIGAEEAEVIGPGVPSGQVNQATQSDQANIQFQQTLLHHLENQPVPPAEASSGALDPLADYLGEEMELAYVSWKPINFGEAVRTGFTSVYLAIGSFLRLTAAEQQAILTEAEQSGLKILGFVGGDPEWVNPSRPNTPTGRRETVAEYDRLTAVLDQFSRTSTGSMRFSFATDIEPYTQSWWDGDLTRYYHIFGTIQSIVQEFAYRQPDRVVGGPYNPRLLRFEPFWYQNNHTTESGRTIRGLNDTSWSDVASMTYRNTGDQIASVSQAIRERASGMGSHGMRFMLGVDTNPVSPGVPARTTFSGQLQNISREVLAALQQIPVSQRRWMRGVFIHTGRAVADQTLQTLVTTPPAGVPDAYPVLATSPTGQYTFSRRGSEGVILIRESNRTLRVIAGLAPLDTQPPTSAVFLNDQILEISYGESKRYFLIDSGTLLNGSMVHARLTPDRTRLIYLEFSDLVSVRIATGQKQSLRLGGPGSPCGGGYNAALSELEAVSPSGNFALVRPNVGTPLLVDLRDLSRTPQPVSIPYVSPDRATSVRFLNDTLVESTLDYRLMSGNPTAPVVRRYTVLGSQPMALATVHYRRGLSSFPRMIFQPGVWHRLGISRFLTLRRLVLLEIWNTRR